MLYIGLYRENMKKILSETIRSRALIFGMYNHLEALYQVCSNYALWTKMAPPQVSHRLIKSFFRIWSCCISN